MSDAAEVPTGSKPPISEARLRANRANALLARGPLDPAMTKFNAYRHGLAAKVAHTSDEHRLILLLAGALEPSFGPRTPRQHRLLIDIATGEHRATRACELQALAREDLMKRDRREYDADRRAEAEALAESLPKRPGSVAARLRTTAPGCAVLIARWDGLRTMFLSNGRWDDAQRQEALDLLGVPNTQRVGNPTIPEGDELGLLDFIQEQIVGLIELKSGAMEAREARRFEQMKAGFGLEGAPDVKLYRRYEREARKLADLAIAALREDQANHPDDAAGPEPEPEAAPSAGSEEPAAPEEPAASTPTPSEPDPTPAAVAPPSSAPTPVPPPAPTPTGLTMTASGLIVGPEASSIPNPPA